MRVIYLILSIIIAISVVIEAYVWDLLIVDHGIIFGQVFILHVVSSLMAAFACLYVKISYDDNKVRWFGLYFTLIFLMPGFGLLGVCSVVLHALLYPKKQRGVFWKDTLVPELPYKPVIVDAFPTYGEGGLLSVIKSAGDIKRRVNAVVAAKQINDKMSIPLLQEALKDPEDDVRLLAYAVLDAKTTEITDRISDLLSKLEGEKDLVKARTFYALAQNYWELSFLGLATGNTLDFVLAEAERYANKAANLGWSGSDIEFLIGRILLYQKNYSGAKEYFKLSIENGALESAILPFLAEIAYETHAFVDVRTMLERLNYSCDGNTPIPAIVKSWGCNR